MKRNWISNILIAGVITVLTVFLGLQYYWLSQASEAERERMHKRVEADTSAFADDFNREMQSAYYNFQAEASTWKNSDFVEFARRYDYWKNGTKYPDLISRMVFLPTDRSAVPSEYNVVSQKFEPLQDGGGMEALRDEIGSLQPTPSVIESKSLLVVPIFDPEHTVERVMIRRVASATVEDMKAPEPYGDLVVFLNKDVLTQHLIPDLAAKHFGDGDYVLAVKARDGTPEFETGTIRNDPDASARLFDLKPDNFIFFTDHKIAMERSGAGQRSPGVVFDQRVEGRTLTRSASPDGKASQTYKIEIKSGAIGKQDATRAGVISSKSDNDDPWKLSVQHSSGSVDSYIVGQRNENFAIGLGIYLLLAASILMITISAARVRKFAQRQIDFVSSVSHEFRTPLAVIYSAGENLADGVATDRSHVSQYGTLIKSEGRKLSGMVEQILEFAGARSGRKKYNFGPADISVIARSALEECANTLEESDFEVVTQFSDKLPPANVDREALTSAVQNLILNSVKYSNGSRWIKIATENGSGTVKISVEDKGIGIRESDQKKVFEPFYRAKDVVDAQIHGSGLGLSLVKEIAEAHGGKVNVKSEVEKGSIFTIEIPS